jgi:histidine triad (HIT) family protein
MQECIFCKIIKGEIPSARVYEDDEMVAFMDIGPVVKGHLLVVPRRHYVDLLATPPETLKKLILVVQKLAVAQKKALQADGINIMQSNGRAANQVIDHIHFHIIPRFTSDGHHWNWKAQKYADNKEMQDLAEKIKSAIGS